MALVYTAIDVRQFPEPVQSLAAFIPAAVSLAALRAAGFSRPDLILRFKRISRRFLRPGLLALAGVTLLLLPILGSSQGWQWLPALVYGPASGVSQELYFRSALLSGLGRAFEKPLPLLPAVGKFKNPSLKGGAGVGEGGFANGRATGYGATSCGPAVCKNRGRLALVAHSLIFVGFHLRTFLSLPSFPIALVVGAVLFIAGYGWGWQVRRDRTLVWAMLQHCAFLMLMSMFEW